MIKTNELRACFVKNGYSQKKIAENLGISPNTMSKKMKLGVFDSNEILAMITLLKIDDPASIFFAK